MSNLLDCFSLTLKIGKEKVKFTIDTHEGVDEMFEKLRRVHPQCENKKRETLQKLKNDLETKLMAHNAKPNLVQTIEYYLNKNFNQETTHR